MAAYLRALALALVVAALALPLTPTYAAPVVVEASQTVSAITNICTGESIVFSGTLRTVTIVEDGLGEGRIILSGMKGTEADGTNYVLPYSQGSSIKISPGIVQTFQVNYLIIGLGGAPDTHLHELFHMTFDANGRLTTLNHDLTVTC